MKELIAGVIAVLVVAGVFVEGYRNGVNATETEWKGKYSADLAAATKRTADAQQAARDTEQRHAADMAALDARHTKDMTDAKSAADRTIADLRAGAIRVRDRLTCPAAGTGAAGQAGAGTGLGDAVPRGGFSAADAELVLRIGGEADEVAVQLAACQGIVKGDRE